jgi:HprK-related kinase A
MTETGSPGDLSIEQFSSRISTAGLGFDIGPFRVHIRAMVPDLHEPLHLLYADFPLVDSEQVFTLHADIVPVRAFPWLNRSRVRFVVDGFAPHEDMPIGQALPVLEWGINLVIAMRSHNFLMLHAAVVEKNGHAVVLPGSPGSGKSTLCAALVHSGWRLLSDEFGLVPHGASDFVPVPRPMALKNEAIDAFRSFAPNAVLGPRIPETRKGTVAHVRPPTDSVRRQSELAPARWLVFPRWQAGSRLEPTRLSKSRSLMALATNAFNYDLLGEQGFCTAREIVNACDALSLVYSDLGEAIALLDELVEGDASD